MNIIVFDTETTSLEKPFVYNIGYVVYNTDEKAIVTRRDYVIEQVWHNSMLFTTAYYSNKRELYVNRMRGRSCLLEKFGYVTQQMFRDIKEFNVEHAFAYNSPFDVSVFEFNCDWFKCSNPLDLLNVHDIRGQVFKTIAFTDEYKQYCESHQMYTDSGNYSTTAEAVYRFVSGNEEFIEEHTALADSLIECEILAYCVEQGCEWCENYKVYRSVPRTVLKELSIIDHEGTKHTFPYTSKRKISGVDGYKLSLKE